MYKTFRKIIGKQRNNQLSKQDDQPVRKHIIDIASGIAQVIATCVAIFALWQTIKQSNENLQLTKEFAAKDSLNRSKDAIKDSERLAIDHKKEDLRFEKQIQVYEDQASALDSQYLLARLQFDTNNIDRKRGQLENKIQFAYQDSINNQQIAALNKQIEALNQQSLIALRQEQLAQNKFFKDSTIEEDQKKNSEVQFYIELEASGLKFDTKSGIYRRLDIVYTNISNRSADSVAIKIAYVGMINRKYFKYDETTTPGEMKPNESRTISVFRAPVFHKNDTIALITIINYRDKLTNKPLPSIGCIRLLARSNGEYIFPTDYDKQRIFEMVKEKDSSMFKYLSNINYQ